MNQRKFLVMNWVNVLKQNKTKQKYQKFRFKILRYCENKMHKMLNENLAHKNGLLHVYMYMIYILMNLIGYIGLLDIPVFWFVLWFIFL